MAQTRTENPNVAKSNNKAEQVLPQSIIGAIDRISDSPEEKRRRTASALRYQRLFPNRPVPDYTFTLLMAQADMKAKPLPVTKPGDADYPTHNTTECCVECGDVLPRLSRPRVHSGRCINCVRGKVEAIA